VGGSDRILQVVVDVQGGGPRRVAVIYAVV
jgi:hypothetical protein